MSILSTRMHGSSSARKISPRLRYIDKALALDSVPGFELLDHAGDIYFYNGDTPRAVELWERALKLHPDDAVLQKKVRHRTYFED